MNTSEVMSALGALRLNLFQHRFFTGKYQQIMSGLSVEFNETEIYFDGNNTFKIQLSDEKAKEMRESLGDYVIPSIYDKVNTVVLTVFHQYRWDIKSYCKEANIPEAYSDYILSGDCPYIGVLYQARFINNVILIEF